MFNFFKYNFLLFFVADVIYIVVSHFKGIPNQDIIINGFDIFFHTLMLGMCALVYKE